MPYKNDLLQQMLYWIQSHAPTIYAVILTITISYVRLTSDGAGFKKKLIESFLCGLLTLAVSDGLSGLGAQFGGYAELVEQLKPFIGGVIGFLGVSEIRKFTLKMVNKQLGIKDKEDE